MDGTECVTNFVGNDKPLSGGLCYNVGAGGCLVGVSASCCVVDTDLSEPCVTDCWARNALCQESFIMSVTTTFANEEETYSSKHSYPVSLLSTPRRG